MNTGCEKLTKTLDFQYFNTKFLITTKIKNNDTLTFTLQAMALLEIQINIVLKTKMAINPFLFTNNFN